MPSQPSRVCDSAVPDFPEPADEAQQRAAGFGQLRDGCFEMLSIRGVARQSNAAGLLCDLR